MVDFGDTKTTVKDKYILIDLMRDDNEILKFSPKCFQKDIEKLFMKKKNSSKSKLCLGIGNKRIFEIDGKNSLNYTTSIVSEFSSDFLLEEIIQNKNIKEWCPYVRDSNIIFNIDTNCDLFELEPNILLYMVCLRNKIKLIRFWSYNRSENTQFLLIKSIDDKNSFLGFKLKKAVIKIKSHPNDKTKSILSFDLKVSKCFFCYLFRKICIEICNSLINFIGMIKIKEAALEDKNNILQNNLNDPSDLSISGHKFILNYFLNLELPKINLLNYSNDSNKDDILLNTEKNIRIITNFNNDIFLIKSYFEVKNEISSIYSDNYFTDNEIIRYVYGLKGNTSKIIPALKELDKFRKNLKSNEIKQEEFDSNQFQWDKLGHVLCLDNHMRPVILIRLHFLKDIPKDRFNFYDKLIRYVIFIFNKAIFLMPTNVDKYIIIVDCKNSMLDNFPDEYLNKLSELLRNFYVERLANLFIIRKGMMFPMIWNKVKEYFKSGNLLDKIILIKDYKEELSGLIPEDRINSL